MSCTYRCMTKMSHVFSPVRILLQALYEHDIFVTHLRMPDIFVMHLCLHIKLSCICTCMIVTRLSFAGQCCQKSRQNLAKTHVRGAGCIGPHLSLPTRWLLNVPEMNGQAGNTESKPSASWKTATIPLLTPLSARWLESKCTLKSLRTNFDTFKEEARKSHCCFKTHAVYFLSWKPT